jgi:copper homeostasis protein
MTIPLLEVCVDDAESLLAAFEGGADRIELCAALELGGLTPTPGLMHLAATLPIPTYAMVRPRPGDFVFGEAEVGTMLADIEAIRAAGLAGVVLGATKPDGSLDVEVLKRLAEGARDLGMTLHRAFDLAPDSAAAVEAAVELGFERILTSGGALTAPAGIDGLRRTMAAARGRIGIMPGSGLTAVVISGFLEAVPAYEVHSSCSLDRAGSEANAIRLGFARESRRVTTRESVANFRRAMAGGR